MMRLSFASGERADVVVEGGVVNLGHAEGNTLVLLGRDVAPWHARLVVDQRGIVLEVLDPHATTHVNARPVRERALLRCGDTLCLGRTAILLKADRDDSVRTAIPPVQAAPDGTVSPARVVLRGVSGSHVGKAIGVASRRVVGGSDGDLALDDARSGQHHAAIEVTGDAIWLRDLGSGEPVRVNGVQVRDAELHSGDQVAFGRHLFVVEAPTLRARGAEEAKSVGAADDVIDPSAEIGRAKQYGVWWLLGAAVVIAAGLLLLIHRGI